MKPITYPCIRTGRAGLLAVALTLPQLQADLVGQWRGTDYTAGGDWTSTAATGSITATANNAANIDVSTTGYVSGTQAVDLFGGYFVVSAANNPVAGATSMSIVVLFNPLSAGASGDNFHQGSGLAGMEIGGVTSDWGLGWNNNRVGGAVAAPGVLERTIFSDALTIEQPKVAMLTWSDSGEQQLFINGEFVRSQDTGAMSPLLSADFALGAMTSGGGNPFNGEIAEIRLYDSDESANAATIAEDLIDTYVDDITLESAQLSPQGGTFVIVDSAQAQVDGAGTFALDFDLTTVPPGDVQVSKTGDRTTIQFTAPVDHGSISYFYDLTVPLVGGGSVNLSDSAVSHRLPTNLPGTAGTVGSWDIGEILTGGAVANAGDIASAANAALGNPFDQQATVPVFNHRDPDTNGLGSIGEYNNDFPILVDVAGIDDNFVVVGKTKVNIASAGELHTFSVRSDDGFAMRVTGPGGGRFIDVGGQGRIDEGDLQTLYRDGGTGDSNSRGTYRFDAAGEYEITYLGWDGGGGGYYEVAWAPGDWREVRDTNGWELLGDDTDPSIPPLQERFASNPPGPAAEEGTFGVRTYLNTGATGLGNATDFLNTTTREPDDGLGDTFDAQLPFLNHRDPNNGASYYFTDPLAFPGNDNGVDENNVVTVAKGRISIDSAGTFTFLTTSDDGFVFRLKGVDGAPDPSFRRVTGGTDVNGGAVLPRFQMSNPNEVFFDGAGVTTRAIVDLDAGEYDIEYITVENIGGFAYELGVAAGEWPHQTAPPGGFGLVGTAAQTILYPAIAAPGWTVTSSIPGLVQYSNSIAGAESRITHTENLASDDPVWATLGLDPSDHVTTWPLIDFTDPEEGNDGGFTPTNPWPLNTGNADNDYAMRAEGNLVITQAGYYHLGFQGDDGGYMYLYGEGGNADPTFESIVYTNLATVATIADAPGSAGGTANALLAETGTGNSRTIGRVYLETGEYRIQTLVWEGGGGSFWEVIGGSGVYAANLPLLSTTAGSMPVAGGLPLVAQPVVEPGGPAFQLTDVVVSGSPPSSVTFNIASEDGVSYNVEASTDLSAWIVVESNVVGAGTSTPVTVFLGDFVELDGQPRVFFRVETAD